MNAALRLPALTPTMTEGVVARWLVNVGDIVEAGQVIAEIETDKAVMDIVAFRAGRIADILVPAGSDPVPVDTPIARFEGEGPEEPVEPPLRPESLEQAPAIPLQPGSAPSVRSSPAARRAAREAGLEIATVPGTGPSGRIVRLDVERAGQLTAPSDRPFERKRMSMMRRSIVERMSRAKREAPHFYLRADLNMARLVELRAGRSSVPAEACWTVNDAFVKAAALGLREVPAINVEFAGDHVRQYNCVDVAIAVAVPDGLVTPVVRDADRKTLVELALEAHELTARAREGRLQPEEYVGGSMTVSNLGMFGVREFAAILNPPQALILAVGAVEPRPIVLDGKLAVAEVCTVTLSCDHRVVDGAGAAAFLAALRRFIESPMELLR